MTTALYATTCPRDARDHAPQFAANGPFAFVGDKRLLVEASPAQSLREEADRVGILVGAAVRQLSEPAYASTLAREFNMVEPEDAMKWWVVRPDQANFDFTTGDQVVAFAEAHSMKVRGHTLVWGWSNPPW